MRLLFSSALFLSFLFLSCNAGPKTTKLTFNGGELLYTDSITEVQAKKLGDFLVNSGFYDGKEKTVQIDKQEDIIHFAMILTDSLAFSDDYHNMGLKFIDELETYVFKGSPVELDYCDKYMKVKKNIKKTDTAKDIPNAKGRIYGSWVCSDITGGNESDPSKTASDLAVLKTNFTFTFNDDSSFESDFVNQEDVHSPIPIKGFYTIVNEKISFHHLSVNGEEKPHEMLFTFLQDNNTFQLVSHTEGVDDVIMTFAKRI